MDCISHIDILPYLTSELSPIDHDLFDKIFTRENDDSSGILMKIRSNVFAVGRIVMRPQLLENYMASQRSWMAPRDVYR